MKRIMTLAAMFAAVAMTFSACQPEDKPSNEGENNGQENVDPGQGDNSGNNGNTGNNGDTGTTTPPADDLAPEVKDGDVILATNEWVEKFLTDVQYPTHDYSYSSLKSWADENGISVSPCTTIATDKPQVYTIRWAAEEADGEITAKLWEDTWSREWTLSAGTRYLEISNLCPNTHYCFEVKAGEKLLTEGEFDVTGKCRQMFFKTKQRNTRDIGGWMTESGKRVRYRMIYRGGRLYDYHLSKSGRADLVAEGIRGQLDLRGEDDVLSESSLIGIVEDPIFCAPVIEEGYIWLLRDDQEKMRQCMEFIMDCVADEVPMIYHCSLGRDRTGTVTMIILGLLGVPEGDISQEYELTQFAPHGYATSDNEKTKMYRTVDYKEAANYIWDNFVDESAGETFADGVEKYLLSIGITQEDIDKFRENMLK